MFKDKVEPDANGVYWGDPQNIHLEEKCTGTVVALAKVYCAPTKVEAIKYKGRRNYQFNTIVLGGPQFGSRQYFFRTKKIEGPKFHVTRTSDSRKIKSLITSPPQHGDAPSPAPLNTFTPPCARESVDFAT
jgi:hypothetical protein